MICLHYSRTLNIWIKIPKSKDIVRFTGEMLESYGRGLFQKKSFTINGIINGKNTFHNRKNNKKIKSSKNLVKWSFVFDTSILMYTKPFFTLPVIRSKR